VREEGVVHVLEEEGGGVEGVEGYAVGSVEEVVSFHPLVVASMTMVCVVVWMWKVK